jgi:tRNA(fMet)-specific endonuclease VapC
MSGKYLLDTNIVIRLFAEDQVVIIWLKEAPEIYIPSIVLGELFYGAQKSANIESNTLKIIELSYHSTILPCDSETAKHYGNIKNQLKKKGRPLPENDIWIGAIAKQHGLSLVSGDLHFKEIEDISLLELK